uniref:Uncharacterized protein n=1 Tax=Timema shepardi TaxID=629360 RepID=A0A7R9ARQ5_TIMSH|nr:unnamed protein product [Timema shepardi]
MESVQQGQRKDGNIPSSPSRHVLNFFFSDQEHDQANNAEDVLFEMFKNEDDGLLSIGKFLAAETTPFQTHCFTENLETLWMCSQEL